MQSSAPSPGSQSTWDSSLSYRGQHIREKHVNRSHLTVWSHNFQKMDVCSHRNIVSSHHQHLITPKKICSHHQFSRSHRHNFVHTMKMLITLLKILFTPSKFCSHHLFSGSHRNNFVHTIKILFTLWKVWSQIKCKNHEYVVQNMQTSHRFALFTHGWYERHTYSLKSSLCGVT